MKSICNATLTFLILQIAALAPVSATMPLGPPMTSGSGDAGMKHAGVTLAGVVLGVAIPEPPASPVVMTDHGFNNNYTATKFDVLEGVYYNAQHGWNPEGFINLPSDRFIWIERTGATQPSGATLQVYEGGNMISETMGDWTMQEIYLSNGEIWQWDGFMQHDYFTADRVGDYSMSFKVYVGNASGVEDITYTPAAATFEFSVVPEPSSLAISCFAALGLLRRRC